MEYPFQCKIKVPVIFGSQEISIMLNSGLTIFVGENAAGKTQTLKALRDELRRKIGNDKVRYLSSNRIGMMEQYRSQINQYNYPANDFLMGNRSEIGARHQIETATGDFFTMDEKKEVYIKVSERLSILFGRHVFIRWDSGYMKVFFGKNELEEEYSVAAEASGLINLVSILCALYDEDINVLLIDEPEVSLHPQLQSYLLREIEKSIQSYNKTVIISTHSTEMIVFNSPVNLKNIVFFSSGKIPLQISPDAPELRNRKLTDFLMRLGQIYKTGFFCKKVILIEGPSDLILCHFLNNKLDLNLDVAGSQIIPVDGKGQFPIITKFFRLVGKEVVVLTDLDGFLDDNNIVDLYTQLPNASMLANKLGSASLSEMNRLIKSSISELCLVHKDDMLSQYREHPYWKNRSSEDDEMLQVRRALVATLFSKDDTTISGWIDATKWVSLKERLNTLFTALGSLGCFVLKKGAIESYYHFSQNDTYCGKPGAAVDEVSELYTQNNTFIEVEYADIIGALRYASITNYIDESYAIRRELLSELALILAVLPTVKHEKEIYSAIKQTKGNTTSLFNYELLNNGGKLGIKVSFVSKIIDVKGFPFNIYIGDNVNNVVAHAITNN